MNGQDSKAEVFDVFLCHNSEDKPAVRKVAQKLSQENIKPWLDEADIKAGSFWDITIGQQIETVKAAAVFIGQHGVGPWQRREIIALLDQFDRRGCEVIPVILESAPIDIVLPCLPALAFCDSGSGQHPEEFQGNAYHSLKIIALFCLAYARSASNPRTASGATVYGLNGLRPTLRVGASI